MRYSELITFVNYRLGHDQRYSVNNKKILNELNWTPSTSFEEGLKYTIKWYIKNS